jgi:hypothetical protein
MNEWPETREWKPGELVQGMSAMFEKEEDRKENA